MKIWQTKNLMAIGWKKKLILLSLVIIVAIFYRFYLIDQLPRGLNRDEAAIAYNAWLLAETGQDEWQKTYPIVLESFGDTRLPVYPYFLSWLYKILPVNDLVVRLPSVMASVGIILFTWLILNKIYNDKVAWWASFLLAVNPIFIWYSRGAWEVNLGLFWLVLICWLGVDVYQDKIKWTVGRLLLILLLLMIACLSYNTPLLVVMAIWPFLPWFFNQKGKAFYLPLMLTILLAVIPCLIVLMPATKKKNNITIFTEIVTHHQYVEYRQQLSGLKQKFLGNRSFFMIKKLSENTLMSFSPKFWWRGGEHPWHQLSEHSHFNFMTMVLVYGSLMKLTMTLVLKLKRGHSWWQSNELKGLVFLALTLAPSVITVDAPHATRSLIFFYCLMAMTAITMFNQVKWQKLIIVPIAVMLIISWESGVYFTHYCQILKNTNLYQSGIGPVLDDEGKPTLIINSDERDYQYIKLAWEKKIPATLFWQSVVRENPNPAGIIAVSDLANYHFFDDEAEPWPNWQIVSYNKELQIWERQK